MDLYSVYMRTVDGKLYKVLVERLGAVDDLDLHRSISVVIITRKSRNTIILKQAVASVIFREIAIIIVGVFKIDPKKKWSKHCCVCYCNYKIQ